MKLIAKSTCRLWSSSHCILVCSVCLFHLVFFLNQGKCFPKLSFSPYSLVLSDNVAVYRLTFPGSKVLHFAFVFPILAFIPNHRLTNFRPFPLQFTPLDGRRGGLRLDPPRAVLRVKGWSKLNPGRLNLTSAPAVLIRHRLKNLINGCS